MSNISSNHSSVKLGKHSRFLICYSGLAKRQSKRWHTFLRSCGVRLMAGVYELEHMRPRLSRRLYQEALEAVSEGGFVKVYPVCGQCERRGWVVGKTELSAHTIADQALSQAEFYLV